MKKVIFSFVTICLLTISMTAFGDEPALRFPDRDGSSEEAHKHNLEGINHYNQGHYDVALKHFKTASKIDPTAGEAHYNEALCLDKLGQHGEAAMHFKAAQKNARGNKKILDSGILKAHLR